MYGRLSPSARESCDTCSRRQEGRRTNLSATEQMRGSRREVDLPPAKGEQLTHPQTGERGE